MISPQSMRGLEKAWYIVINDFRGKLYLSFFIINMLFKIKFLVKYWPRK